jgi:5'-deoxynucleotidase YfbR-like HD superfamily hydrolase
MGTHEEFFFDIPPERPDVSDKTNLILQVGAIANRLAHEDRKLVDHADGRPENVAEHTFMLCKIATVLTLEYYPHLDAGLVSQCAIIHDDIEAYTKDVSTFDPTPELLADKDAREQLGLELFKQQYAHMPSYVLLVETYLAQKEPETQLVRIVDKFMPIVSNLSEGGDYLRGFHTREKMDYLVRERAESLKIEYPDWTELIDILYELSDVAKVELLE